MTIGELLETLKRANQDANIKYSFGGCSPTKIGSWRGIYAEPALGWEDADQYPTVRDVVAELELSLDGRTYYGYKGGEYAFRPKHELHIDNPGKYTCTEIDRVELDDTFVVIHTKAE